MMLRTIVILFVVSSSASADWELYKSVYGKSYSPREEIMRRAVFMRNVVEINAHNLRHDLGLTTYRMGLSPLTDRTSDEFRAMRGLQLNATKTIRTGKKYSRKLSFTALPDTVDWREKGYVTPVKNQGTCLSCWAFAAVGAVEGQHFRATGKLVSLSEQNLIDCSGIEGNMGCKGGWLDKAFTYIKDHGGINTEESYPYNERDGECQFVNDIGAHVTGFVPILDGNEDLLQEALATVGPVAVNIDASKMSFQKYRTGVFDEPDCSSEILDHAVLVVGYGTENGVDYWLVKNSWGPMWGLQGYIKMSRNKNNQCGIATRAYYPLV